MIDAPLSVPILFPMRTAPFLFASAALSASACAVEPAELEADAGDLVDAGEPCADCALGSWIVQFDARACLGTADRQDWTMITLVDSVPTVTQWRRNIGSQSVELTPDGAVVTMVAASAPHETTVLYLSDPPDAEPTALISWTTQVGTDACEMGPVDAIVTARAPPY